MSYPAAFCVRCQEHVEPNNKHTIVMRNNSRALTGTCPKCASEVYRIMPKKVLKQSPKVIRTLRKQFPQGFCFGCKAKRSIDNHQTVILENSSLAVKGNCIECDTEVYKLLKNRVPAQQTQLVANGSSTSHRLNRSLPDKPKLSSQQRRQKAKALSADTMDDEQFSRLFGLFLFLVVAMAVASIFWMS